MEKLLLTIAGIALLSISTYAQKIEKQAPQGFDQPRTGISMGKLDTIRYESKTVGATRKALVYTPPGYNKKTKY
ncbi:MAG TPA: esterase, partial [Haliscomenobacter sp.]|nr:esterase [Haliscomenobacter sp.]